MILVGTANVNGRTGAIFTLRSATVDISFSTRIFVSSAESPSMYSPSIPIYQIRTFYGVEEDEEKRQTGRLSGHDVQIDVYYNKRGTETRV